MVQRRAFPMLLGAGVSLAAHVLCMWRISGAPSRAPMPVDEGVAIELVAWTPATEAGAQGRQQPRPDPARPSSVGEPTRRRRLTARETPVSSASPVGPSPSPPPAPRVPAAAEAAPDLSPAAVAANMSRWLPADTGRVCQPRPPRTPADLPECTSEGSPSQAIAAPLQRELSALASRAPRSHAPPPKLHRQPDGSYDYEESRFTARIAPDGSVTLQDRPVVQSAFPIPIVGSFDLTDAIEKHILGKTLYPAQKRHFLEATAGLRAQLADRDRERSFAGGKLRLIAELERIITDPNASPARKRGQVFELWDGCATDEDGARGQHIIEAFVRDRMSRATALGYSAAELAALNARRASSRSFDPYGPGAARAVAGSAG